MDCGIGESTMDDSYSSDAVCDTGNFECNICFELAQEPTVSPCGHLYCWPCLCQWLQLHSHSHECPVCKAIIQEDKLIPIYGRGKTVCDPRSRLLPGLTIPNRPMAHRPHITQRTYVRPNELDQGFIPAADTGFRHPTLSTLFGVLPAIFNLQVNGFHDATVYGTTSGVPYLFSSSFHGGYVHGFHHYSAPIEWKQVAWKIVLVAICFVILLHLIFWSSCFLGADSVV